MLVPLLKLGGTNFKEKHFQNHFLWFSCPKKQFFCIMETYFSTNASFSLVETNFLGCTNHFLYVFRDHCRGKLFCLSTGNVFWMNPSFRLLEKDLFSSVARYFIWKFFSTSENHRHEWRSIFKYWTYSCWWKLVFWLVETIFFHGLIYFSRSPSSHLA